MWSALCVAVHLLPKFGQKMGRRGRTCLFVLGCWSGILVSCPPGPKWSCVVPLRRVVGAALRSRKSMSVHVMGEIMGMINSDGVIKF
jgi:hypothetical protein